MFYSVVRLHDVGFICSFWTLASYITDILLCIYLIRTFLKLKKKKKHLNEEDREKGEQEGEGRTKAGRYFLDLNMANY